MTQTYRILKELGNHRLRKYIYENIAEAIFDSHRITSRFPQDSNYETIIIAFYIDALFLLAYPSQRTYCHL